MNLRELDALVAEYVMGEKHAEFVRPGVFQMQDGFTTYVGDPKPYSTNISAAWDVVEKFREFNPFWESCDAEAHMAVQISPSCGPNNRLSWMVNFGDTTTLQYGETLPLAICLAALNSKGIKVSELRS